MDAWIRQARAAGLVLIQVTHLGNHRLLWPAAVSHPGQFLERSRDHSAPLGAAASEVSLVRVPSAHFPGMSVTEGGSGVASADDELNLLPVTLQFGNHCRHGFGAVRWTSLTHTPPDAWNRGKGLAAPTAITCCRADPTLAMFPRQAVGHIPRPSSFAADGPRSPGRTSLVSFW
jgi:hypothetical protein